MKLIFVRHGDPDYEHDTLTEVGRMEAQCVADRLSGRSIQKFYVSPLGRAQDTARPTLEAMNATAETCEWLQEFNALIFHPDTEDTRIPWDWLPSWWTAEPLYYDKDKWTETEIMKQHGVREKAQKVCNGIDQLLSFHGYVRDGMVYRVERPNDDVLCFFCHFGVECLILGHLIGCSPMVLWHGFCAAPSSVTVVSTEERRKGTASFRINTFGDTGHLYHAGHEPSFSARFCELYDNINERHD